MMGPHRSDQLQVHEHKKCELRLKCAFSFRRSYPSHKNYHDCHNNATASGFSMTSSEIESRSKKRQRKHVFVFKCEVKTTSA